MLCLLFLLPTSRYLSIVIGFCNVIIGSVIVKVVPFSSYVVTEIFPPCCSMMFFQSYHDSYEITMNPKGIKMVF